MENLSIPRISLFFALIILTISSCRNKPEIIDPVNLLGKWNAVVYTIDAQEQIGTNFNSVQLNFGEIREGIGPFALTTVDINGSSLAQGGEYSLSLDFRTIYLMTTGNTIEYAIKFDEDSLIMMGTDDNNQEIEFNCEKEE